MWLVQRLEEVSNNQQTAIRRLEEKSSNQLAAVRRLEEMSDNQQTIISSMGRTSPQDVKRDSPCVRILVPPAPSFTCTMAPHCTGGVTQGPAHVLQAA